MVPSSFRRSRKIVNDFFLSSRFCVLNVQLFFLSFIFLFYHLSRCRLEKNIYQCTEYITHFYFYSMTDKRLRSR